MTIHLLVIDPQNDFCDLPADLRPVDPRTGAVAAPALPVAGAHADMRRLAGFIRDRADDLDDITLTLDSHHRVDIAHPPFWRRADGGAVPPFTTITAAQVRAGEFAPRDAAALARVLAYLDTLEASGRYTLMVWPVHCEMGSWGHEVHADVRAACGEWAARRGRPVREVTKGENPWTEHYSAIQAEVPDAADPATQLNRALLAELDKAETILVAGEAGSHCVRATTEHIVANLPSGRPGRVRLLADCMSPVAGFEEGQAEFFRAIQAQGAEVIDTATFLARMRP